MIESRRNRFFLTTIRFSADLFLLPKYTPFSKRHHSAQGDELQLTDAMKTVAQTERMVAVDFVGKDTTWATNSALCRHRLRLRSNIPRSVLISQNIRKRNLKTEKKNMYYSMTDGTIIMAAEPKERRIALDLRYDAKNKEYVWTVTKSIGKSHAPNLFPVCRTHSREESILTAKELKIKTRICPRKKFSLVAHTETSMTFFSAFRQRDKSRISV